MSTNGSVCVCFCACMLANVCVSVCVGKVCGSRNSLTDCFSPMSTPTLLCTCPALPLLVFCYCILIHRGWQQLLYLSYSVLSCILSLGFQYGPDVIICNGNKTSEAVWLLGPVSRNQFGLSLRLKACCFCVQEPDPLCATGVTDRVVVIYLT